MRIGKTGLQTYVVNISYVLRTEIEMALTLPSAQAVIRWSGSTAR